MPELPKRTKSEFTSASAPSKPSVSVATPLLLLPWRAFHPLVIKITMPSTHGFGQTSEGEPGSNVIHSSFLIASPLATEGHLNLN